MESVGTTVIPGTSGSAVRLPKDMDFENVAELEIRREGNTIILRPIKPSWESFSTLGKADANFLDERLDVIAESRVSL